MDRRFSVSNIEDIIYQIVKFRDNRDWGKFHNAKDLAIALNIESAELLELFLWKNSEDADKSKVKEELADILIYAYLLVDKCQLNVAEIIEEKLLRNAEKYPVVKSKGNSKKYTEL